LIWEEAAAAPVARLDGAAVQIAHLLYVFAGYATIDEVVPHLPKLPVINTSVTTILFILNSDSGNEVYGSGYNLHQHLHFVGMIFEPNLLRYHFNFYIGISYANPKWEVGDHYERQKATLFPFPNQWPQTF